MLGFLAVPATCCFLTLAFVPFPYFKYEIEHDWTVTIGGEWHGVRQVVTNPGNHRRTEVRIGPLQFDAQWRAAELVAVASLVLVASLAGCCYAIAHTRGDRGR